MKNNYLIYFKHYKQNTKAFNIIEAKKKAIEIFKPRKNDMCMIGAWKLDCEGGAYSEVQV